MVNSIQSGLSVFIWCALLSRKGRQTDRDIQKQRDRDTVSDRQKQRDRDRQRQTQIDKDIETFFQSVLAKLHAKRLQLPDRQTDKDRVILPICPANIHANRLHIKQQ